MRLKYVNNALLALIIVIDGYIVIAPALPGLLFNWQNPQVKRQALQRQIQLPAKTAPPAAPQPNHVVIPSMLLDQPILEGPTIKRYQILNNGIWHWPLASTPDKGGNTVLIGHRFTYTNPKGVFYFLNKVQLGNQIAVYWNNKEYLYKVVSINQVSATDTAIENNTANPELTLFTCTPLWLPTDRLVVVADLESQT